MRTLSRCLGVLMLSSLAACGGSDPPPQNPEISSGVPVPFEGVYFDFGPAPRTAGFRALIGFPVRDRAGLQQAIEAMYDPAQPSFRQYMSVEEWMGQHAPASEDVEHVRGWLEGQGFSIGGVASNLLQIEFTGTVGQFNDAFQTELHQFERENPAAGNPPIEVYGVTSPLRAPQDIIDRTTGVVTADLPAEAKDLPGEGGDIVVQQPADVAQGMSPAQIAHAYDVDDLYALDSQGQGVKLGLVTGATFKFKDLQSFWQSFGITRADPTTVETLEPVSTRFLETTLDVQWAGAMAPGAEVIAYHGPDARNTSIVYTFNEAIALGEVSVLSTSFAHREETEAELVRSTYDDSAMMGAALGITIVVASGDSARTDIPSSSPYVTCVGGTQLALGADGEVASEAAWSESGSGVARSFALPWYQEGVVTDSDGKRAVADVALNASPDSSYWVYYLAEWDRFGGTSFAAPAFAGIIAVVNSHRAASGKPPVGLLNPALYQSADVQAAFRDVVTGETIYYAAGPGWDYPTGWGVPKALELAEALP